MTSVSISVTASGSMHADEVEQARELTQEYVQRLRDRYGLGATMSFFPAMLEPVAGPGSTMSTPGMSQEAQQGHQDYPRVTEAPVETEQQRTERLLAEGRGEAP